MVTTRRSINESYERTQNENNSNRGSGLALLEREEPVSNYAKFVAPENEDATAAKKRMQASLERLLNYERYNNIQVANVDKTAEKSTETVQNSAPSDDDLRPTSTTLQFGDTDTKTILNEMKKEKKERAEYKLTSKGKLAIVIYSIVVAAILAFIIINTGIIARISKQEAIHAEQLNVAVREYNESVDKYNYSVSEENIRYMAENVYNMVLD